MISKSHSDSSTPFLLVFKLLWKLDVGTKQGTLLLLPSNPNKLSITTMKPDYFMPYQIRFPSGRGLGENPTHPRFSVAWQLRMN